MSNIDVQNMKYGLDRKIYKVLGMSKKDYMGTYDFIVRQTINYEKKSNGKDSNKIITIISNPEGNYIDYVKGKKQDQNNLSFGKRCVFIKNNIIITGAGEEPNVALLLLKIKAISKLFFNLAIVILFIYLGYRLLMMLL